jgi:hypothetical protein
MRAGFTHIAIGGTLAFALATATAAAGPVTHFELSGLPSFTAVGALQMLTVAAEDASNTLVSSYTGTVQFTSTDPIATFPSDYTFVSFDAGTHAFPVEFLTLGPQSITVTDTVYNVITGTATTMVTGGASVPEPGTCLLLLTALGFLGSSRFFGPGAKARKTTQDLVSVCRRQALSSSTTRRLRRRERIEMNAIATKAMRCSFERSKMVFNRR